jgi:4-hydroxy-3-polyprenylbenzoate decarboxylase
MNLGSKMVLDATRKPGKRPPKKMIFNRDTFEGLKRKDPRIAGWQLWGDALLMVQVKQDSRWVLEALVKDPLLEGVKIVAVVSLDVDLADRESAIWGLFTRFDCARDIVFTETKLVGPTVRYGGRLGIDATWKPGYPDPLEMPEEIVQKVNTRWSDYGIG